MPFLRQALDLLWPRVCEACGGSVTGPSRYLCWECLAALPLIQPPFCVRCGDPVEGAITHDFVCSACVDRPPGFDRARSAVRYRGPVRDVLQRFKYSAATHLARDLGELLHACVRTHFGQTPLDAVVYVPLHAAKQRARTYNQSRLLAGDLARRMGLPLADGCLRRARHTVTQTHLSARERMQNVRGAFAALNERWIEGRHFLLVDDVMTTGATVSECGQVLKRAGAAGVWVVTAARG